MADEGEGAKRVSSQRLLVLSAISYNIVGPQIYACEQFSNVKFCILLLSVETCFAQKAPIWICVCFSLKFQFFFFQNYRQWIIFSIRDVTRLKFSKIFSVYWYPHGSKSAKSAFFSGCCLCSNFFPLKLRAGFPVSRSHKTVLHFQKMIQKSNYNFLLRLGILDNVIMPGNTEGNVGDRICIVPLKSRFKTRLSFFKHLQKLVIKHCNGAENVAFCCSFHANFVISISVPS